MRAPALFAGLFAFASLPAFAAEATWTPLRVTSIADVGCKCFNETVGNSVTWTSDFGLRVQASGVDLSKLHVDGITVGGVKQGVIGVGDASGLRKDKTFSAIHVVDTDGDKTLDLVFLDVIPTNEKHATAQIQVVYDINSKERGQASVGRTWNVKLARVDGDTFSVESTDGPANAPLGMNPGTKVSFNSAADEANKAKGDGKGGDKDDDKKDGKGGKKGNKHK